MNDTLIAELLAEHSATKKTLEKSKAKEMKLRNKIISLVFPEAHKGTNKVAYKDLGINVKAVIKENWSVKQEGLSDLLCEHEEIQKAFKYKYELVMKGYNELTDELKVLLAEQVTCKDGAPELSYEGELKYSFLGQIKLVDDDVAAYYGFDNVEQLKSLLEEIS